MRLMLLLSTTILFFGAHAEAERQIQPSATIPAPVKTASGSNQITITVGWTDVRAQTGSGVASAATAPGSFVLTTEF